MRLARCFHLQSETSGLSGGTSERKMQVHTLTRMTPSSFNHRWTSPRAGVNSASRAIYRLDRRTTLWRGSEATCDHVCWGNVYTYVSPATMKGCQHKWRPAPNNKRPQQQRRTKISMKTRRRPGSHLQITSLDSAVRPGGKAADVWTQALCRFHYWNNIPPRKSPLTILKALVVFRSGGSIKRVHQIHWCPQSVLRARESEKWDPTTSSRPRARDVGASPNQTVQTVHEAKKPKEITLPLTRLVMDYRKELSRDFNCRAARAYRPP